MSSCIFCNLSEELWIHQTQHFCVVWDIDPIQEGHMLLISKEHRMSLLALTEEESADLVALQKLLLSQVENQDGWGGTLAINNGKLMDEGTHFHCHLIPRFKEDGFWEGVDPEARSFAKENFLKELSYG